METWEGCQHLEASAAGPQEGTLSTDSTVQGMCEPTADKFMLLSQGEVKTCLGMGIFLIFITITLSSANITLALVVFFLNMFYSGNVGLQFMFLSP